MMKTYFLYDGRANYDIESASVMECFEAKSDSDAKCYVNTHWNGYDTVLCDHEDNIIY